MINIINSNNNKEFLWNLLYENNIFSNIPNSELNNIKSIFENNINDYSLNLKLNSAEKYTQEKLIELDKSILRNIINDINEFKKTLLASKNIKSQLLKEKNHAFNNEFEKKKNDFNESIKLIKPEEIDFRINLDDPLDEEDISKKIEEIQKERELLIPIIDNSINNIDNSINIIDKNINLINKNLNLENIKKRNSKPSFNDSITNEFNSENNFNLNNRLIAIEKILEKILGNQMLILNKNTS